MARAYVYDMVDTWNAGATTFTAIKMNVTDTASAAGSLLMNLQVGGTSKFRIEKNGSIRGDAANGVDLSISYNTLFRSDAGLVGGATGYGLAVSALYGFGWNNGFFGSNVPDLELRRDAADTLAQRRSTNAQAFRVYNTYTDASNYERFELGYVTNVATLRHAFAGTGSSRNLRILTPGNANIFFSANGSDVLSINSGGITFQTDNTYDIGASGANRPRNIYVGTSITCAAGTISVDGGNGFQFITRGYVLSPSDGVFRLTNNAQTDFNRLQFGGTTSSFPSLKRNATALETKLADDSAYAPHAMQYLDVTDGVTAPAAATGRARIYVDTADGDLKIIFADGTIKTIVTDT